MEFTLIQALGIVGSLGLLIYGIKIMSESVQKLMGQALVKLLNVMTRNKFLGILTGLITASMVFSSSSTIVMAVSFVNTGLITLAESVSIMLGANIGNSVLTWIVSIFGFEHNVSFIFIVIFAIGTPLIFSNKNKLKYAGEFIFGLALLFLGLSVILDFVPAIDETNTVQTFFQSMVPLGFLGNIFFVLVGVFLTIIIQSSSAAIVLTQVLCFKGILPFELAIPMVVGQNFGRTIVTEIASLAGNVHAKRSARVNSLINITGFIWAVILLTLFPVLDLLNYMAVEWFNFDSVYSTTGAPIGIALFHTLLNVLNALLLVWFIPQLVSLATNNIKSRGKSDELFQLEQINTGMMATPEVSIFEAQKEIVKFGDITLKMNDLVKSLITEQDPKKINKLINKIQNYEELTDKIEADVAEFLTKTSQRDMSETSSIRIRGMLRIVANLERVGDIYFQMCKTIERKNKNKVWFTPEQRNNVLEMFNLVDKALVAMCENLNSNYDDVSITAAKELEETINSYRTALRKKHFENVEKGEYNFKSATAYSELYNSLEKVGDHIVNVTEGIIGIH